MPSCTMAPPFYVDAHDSPAKPSGPIRTTHRESPESTEKRWRGEPGYCTAPNCGKATRERKPWCTRHVGSHSPYVQEVRARLAQYDRERARLSPVHSGLLAADILISIRERGGASILRIAADCQLTPELANAYVTALAKAGQILTGQNTRGIRVASPSMSA